jgi:hypothetical protein
MKARRRRTTDEHAVPGGEDAAVTDRPPDLTVGMVHHFMRHILETLAAESARWGQQLAIMPRGADFDLRDSDDGTTVLDKLTMTGDALAEALARGDAPDSVGQSILPNIQEKFQALVKRGKAASNDAALHTVLKPHAAALDQLHGGMSNVSRSVGELASLATRGAASLDPDATRRILDRMRNVGDATLRLLEDRIVSSGTREEGKRLRGLRDDLKAWIDARNTRVEQMQAAVDELNIRANALRNECLMQAKRLAAASALAAQGSGRRVAVSSADAAEQASPEAMVLSAALRALLLEARNDITAPIRE